MNNIVLTGDILALDISLTSKVVLSYCLASNAIRIDNDCVKFECNKDNLSKLLGVHRNTIHNSINEIKKVQINTIKQLTKNCTKFVKRDAQNLEDNDGIHYIRDINYYKDNRCYIDYKDNRYYILYIENNLYLYNNNSGTIVPFNINFLLNDNFPKDTILPDLPQDALLNYEGWYQYLRRDKAFIDSCCMQANVDSVLILRALKKFLVFKAGHGECVTKHNVMKNFKFFLGCKKGIAIMNELKESDVRRRYNMI